MLFEGIPKFSVPHVLALIVVDGDVIGPLVDSAEYPVVGEDSERPSCDNPAGDRDGEPSRISTTKDVHRNERQKDEVEQDNSETVLTRSLPGHG